MCPKQFSYNCKLITMERTNSLHSQFTRVYDTSSTASLLTYRIVLITIKQRWKMKQTNKESSHCQIQNNGE